jgi:hypothetical protein
MPLEGEARISTTEALKLIPEPVTRKTLLDWAKRGVRGVRLEALVVGGRYYTSAPAVSRFLAALNSGGGTA